MKIFEVPDFSVNKRTDVSAFSILINMSERRGLSVGLIDFQWEVFPNTVWKRRTVGYYINICE